MSPTFSEIKDATWANEEHTAINITCKISTLDPDKTYRFTATSDDAMDYGRQLFSDLSSGLYGAVAAYQAPVVTQEQILLMNTQALNTRLRACTDAAFPLQARVDAGVATDEQVSQLAALKQYAIDLTDPAIVDLTANPAVFPEMP